MDYIHSLGLLAIASRFKRMTGRLIQDGIDIYKLQGIDFEPRMFTMYYLLYENPEGLQISEVAKSLGITHPAVIKIANIMIKKGLIASGKDDKDARKNVLVLTQKSLDLYPRLKPVWDCFETAIQDLFSEIGYDVTDVLYKMEKALERKEMAERVIDVIKAGYYEKIIIRDYAPNLSSYFKLLNYEWLTDYFSVEPYDELVLSNPESEIIKKGGAVFFAEFEGEIVGVCALMKIDDISFELTKMAVTKVMRRKQIGKKLLDHAVKTAKERGAKKLYLFSDTKLIPAINLYRKNGFKISSEKIDLAAKYERAKNGIMMELDL